MIAVLSSRYPNVRGYLPPVFERVADQVLKHHHDLCTIGGDVRQVTDVNCRRTFVNVMAQVIERDAEGLTQSYHYAPLGRVADL